ncbi:MAG: DMT family transporter [Hungatella sp.]|jgi:drug/metabolite transporter (DMT)-like permease|nr:DMT family transporter [Hungatella sp.]
MKNTIKAYLAITLQALIIGFSFLFVKIALKSADTLSLLAHRFTLAPLCIFIYRFFTPNKTRVSAADWFKIIPFSIAYPILFFLFQTLGLKIISSSEAGIVQATAPVLTLIAARIIIKEQVRNLQKLFMVISVSGVVFINVMNGFNIGNYSYLGFLFILMSAVSFAIYNVLIKKISKDYSVFSIVYVMSIAGCIVFNLISIIQHILNGNISAYFEPFSDPSFVGAIIYLGVFSSLITSLLSTYALGKLDATRVGLFNNVSTVVTILAGTIFLHEPLFYYHYIGIIAILFGTIGFNLIRFPLKDIHK